MTDRYNALVVTPAYGRDYKSKEEAIKAWNEGRDFHAANLGRGYVNIDDLRSFPHGFTHLHIRYANLTKVTVVKL